MLSLKWCPIVYICAFLLFSSRRYQHLPLKPSAPNAYIENVVLNVPVTI